MNYSTIVIDGYNAIHKIENLKNVLFQNIEQSREKFALFLQRWKKNIRYRGEIIVFFDGQSQNFLDSKSTVHGIQFNFSYHDSDADNHIIAYLKKHRTDKKILVITDDNYIRNHCKIYHANFEAVSFLLNPKTKKQVTTKTINTKKNITQKDKVDITNFLKRQWGIS